MAQHYRLSKLGKVWIILAGEKAVSVPLEIQTDGSLEVHDQFVTTEKGDVYQIHNNDGNIYLRKIPVAGILESSLDITTSTANDKTTQQEAAVTARVDAFSAEQTLVKETVAAMANIKLNEQSTDTSKSKSHPLERDSSAVSHANSMAKDSHQLRLLEKTGTPRRGNLQIFFEGESPTTSIENLTHAEENKDDTSKRDTDSKSEKSGCDNQSSGRTVGSGVSGSKLHVISSVSKVSVAGGEVGSHGQLSGRRRLDGLDGGQLSGRRQLDGLDGGQLSGRRRLDGLDGAAYQDGHAVDDIVDNDEETASIKVVTDVDQTQAAAASGVAGSSGEYHYTDTRSNHGNTQTIRCNQSTTHYSRLGDVENEPRSYGYWLRYCQVEGIPEGYTHADLDTLVKGQVKDAVVTVFCEELREAVVICQTNKDAEMLSVVSGAPFCVKHITLPLVGIRKTIKKEVMQALENDFTSVKTELSRIHVQLKTSPLGTCMLEAPTRCQMECAKKILVHYTHTADLLVGKQTHVAERSETTEQTGERHPNDFDLLIKASDNVWDVLRSVPGSAVQELMMKQRNVSYSDGYISVEYGENDSELDALLDVLKMTVKVLNEKQIEEMPLHDHQKAAEIRHKIEDTLRMQCCVVVPNRNAIVAFCDTYEDLQKIKHRLNILEGRLKVTQRGRRWTDDSNSDGQIGMGLSDMENWMHKGKDERDVIPKKRNPDKRKQVNFNTATGYHDLNKYGQRYPGSNYSRDPAATCALGTPLNDPQYGRATNMEANSKTHTMGWRGDEKLNKQYKANEGIHVYVYVGDILKASVDCIVNATNSQMVHGGGLAKKIENAAGPDLKKACDALIRKHKKIPAGEVCSTTAGKLPYAAVLHAVGPVWNDYTPHGQADVETCHRCLALTVFRSLQLAEKHGYKSIGIPALSSAVHGVPVDVCVSSYTMAVLEYSRRAQPDRRVAQIHFIDVNEGMVRHIQRGFEEVKQGRMPDFNNQKFVRGTKTSRSLRCKSVEKYVPNSSRERCVLVGRSAEWPLSDSGRQKGYESDSCASYGQARWKESGVDPAPSVQKQSENMSKSSPEMQKVAGNGVPLQESSVDQCRICLDGIKQPKVIKCGHMFCSECIRQAFSVKKMCPVCYTVCGIITGDQPLGTMKAELKRTSLTGCNNCGTIAITYNFPAGTQGPEHPKPGAFYSGITRTAYLPDNAQGRKLHGLLKVAFKRRLVFTIGRSRTTGHDGVITWNDVTHKTNLKPYSEYGYPDPLYFGNVLQELASKGVTEKDLYATI